MAGIPTEGSVDRPYRQNPPRMFIEVHWGGGTFVGGAARYSEIDAAIRLVAIGGGGVPRWKNIGVGAFGDSGEVMGSATGAGAVVLAGAANSGSTASYGVIMASHDGRTWDLVYTGQKSDDTDTAAGSSVFGVVWDEGKFWAGAHESNNGPNPATDVYEVDILLSSEDGYTWAEAGRRDIYFVAWPDGYPTGLLAAHCSSRVTDSNGNGVPDGIYGRKQLADDELLIRPTVVQAIDYLFGTSGSNAAFATTVRVNDRPVEVGIPVACVANAGGVWVAGGGLLAEGESAQSAYSIDDGKTWTKIDTDGVSAVMCTIVRRTS